MGAKLDIDEPIDLAAIVCLGSIDGRVRFKANVECLTGPEIGLIRGKDARPAYTSITYHSYIICK